MFTSSTFRRFHCVSILLLTAAAPAVLHAQLDTYGPITETNFFGGVNRFFAYQDSPPRMVLNDGPLAGVRETWNMLGHFGLEGSYMYGQNNLRLTPTPGGPMSSVHFASHTGIAFLGGVFYFMGPEHRTRVFVRGGPALLGYYPTQTAQSYARATTNTYLAASNLSSGVEFGGLYGLGVKTFLNKWLALRADFEGTAFPQPHYHLPSTSYGPGAVYIPQGGVGTYYSVSAGFSIGIGHHAEAAPPLPPKAPEPPGPSARLDVTGANGNAIDAGCPGDRQSIPLSVSATTNLPDHHPVYRWMVNDQTAGTDSPQFNFPVPSAAGQYKVSVLVRDDPGISTDKRTADPVTVDVATVTVQSHTDPTLTVSAAQSTLNFGDTTALQINPGGSACNRRMTYTCQTNVGRLTGTPANAFDSSTVEFDADRSRAQTRVASITCTVRDDLGSTARASTNVNVNLAQMAEVRRFDDVVFAKNNARVNNCGKRILLEEVYPLLTQHPDWDLVVVGHTSQSEKKGTQLDRQRLLNVIATMTAGSDTCPRLDLSRVRFVVAGTDQKSDPRPAFCGTSSRVKTTERAGQSITADDADAKFRRVEVYVVPKGAKLPDDAASAAAVPEDAVRALGCPK
jgi:outer membrane protein OmpA-like peptidoglycan-associated protein